MSDGTELVIEFQMGTLAESFSSVVFLLKDAFWGFGEAGPWWCLLCSKVVYNLWWGGGRVGGGVKNQRGCLSTNLGSWIGLVLLGLGF